MGGRQTGLSLFTVMQTTPKKLMVPVTNGLNPANLPRTVRMLLFSLIALFGAGTSATVFGAHSYRWRAFTVQVGILPARTGVSRLEVPPLGAISAHTHRTPLALYARLDAVSFDDLRRLALSSTPRAVLERDLQQFAQHSAIDFGIRLIAWGAVGGLLAPLVFRSRRVVRWIGAPVVGAIFVAALLGLTKASFSPSAFQKKPTFTGSLEQAPRAIFLVQNAVSNTEALGARLRNVSVNLQALYGRIGSASGDPAGDTGTIRILHISDIHNNPAAVAFVKDIAQKFQVAAVIDTGDLSDYGTPVEGRMVRGMRDLRVPYVFVAGNHDSETTMRLVKTELGGIVLRAGDAPVTVAGLRIIGSPDPSSRRADAGSVDTSPADLQKAGADLLAQYKATAPPPDIVCVHNPIQAEPLKGVATLVLDGHLHTPSIQVEDGTVFCNAGTTGAAGARYFERPEGVPFSAAVLHFAPVTKEKEPGATAPHSRLLFIDQVSLQGSLREYSITRRAFGSADSGASSTSAAPRKPAPTAATSP